MFKRIADGYPNFDMKPKNNLQAVGMLLLAPLFGAMFVMFLPCVGFYLLGEALFIRISRDFLKFHDHGLHTRQGNSPCHANTTTKK